MRLSFGERLRQRERRRRPRVAGRRWCSRDSVLCVIDARKEFSLRERVNFSSNIFLGTIRVHKAIRTIGLHCKYT